MRHESAPRIRYMAWLRAACNAFTKAALRMTELGFRTKELIGGLDCWKRDGHPTAR